MPRLREVSRSEVDKELLPLYDALFGPDRDPVKLVDCLCVGP